MEKALREQGQFQDLATQYEAEVKQLRPRVEQLENELAMWNQIADTDYQAALKNPALSFLVQAFPLDENASGIEKRKWTQRAEQAAEQLGVARNSGGGLGPVPAPGSPDVTRQIEESEYTSMRRSPAYNRFG
jgi:hypothetical protein